MILTINSDFYKYVCTNNKNDGKHKYESGKEVWACVVENQYKGRIAGYVGSKGYIVNISKEEGHLLAILCEENDIKI
jgi:hypothetical protein